MTERERPYQITDALIPLASLAATYFVVTGAFSKESRRQILRRDGKCVANGEHLGGLEAAHIDHTRNKYYDNPMNGRALCTQHHLEDHIVRHGRNGLTKSQNKWAINALRGRLGLG